MKLPSLNIKRKLIRTVLLTGLFLLRALYITAQVPVADFSSDKVSGCSPLVVTFKDQSTGNPVFWNWDLGNGQLSNLQNPTAVYSTPGTYSVTLVVRNADGTNGITKTNYITVNASPSANFSANLTTACLPATIQFTDLSVPQGDPIVSWLWDFGDGTSSTAQNPSKTYTTAGFYSISLRVTSSGGCQGTITRGQYIRIVSGVIADFSFTDPPSCRPPYLVNFSNQTSGPGNLSYQWNFGNGTGSTQSNPIGAYAVSGTYKVTLLATSQYGCSNSIQKDVVINGITTAFSSPDSVCLNTTVNFQNISSPTPVKTTWDFGNGQQSGKFSDSSSYSVPGSYAVRMINQYPNCIDSADKIIFVRPKPVVDFNAPVAISCSAPFTVNFQDLSPDAVAWQWDFGDGSTANSKNPSHSYAGFGQFDVTLSITDSKGCTNIIKKTAFVRVVKPTVTINNASAGICLGASIAPTALVNAIDGVSTYSWNFGDGFTSTAPTPPAHTYAATGNYSLTLTIVTNGGCTESVTRNVQVGLPVTVDFSASNAISCASDSVAFTNLTGPGYRYLWDFGDGGSSTLENPKHLYNDSGYFDVSLTVTNNGCPSTLTKPQLLRILPPIAHFTSMVNCTNKKQVSFINTSKTDASLTPLTYAWDFGDGGSTIAINPVHTFPSLGSYNVRLSVTNGGCVHVFDSSIRLVGEQATFSVSKSNICRGETVTFSAINSNAANISNYAWYINGIQNVSGPSFRTRNYTFTAAGSYAIALVITDINGCTDSISVPNAVVVTGPTASFNATTGACRNAPVSFTDGSTGSVSSWTWDFGDGTVQTLNAPFTHQYADTGTYTVSLTVKDNNGCSNTYTLPKPILITHPTAGFNADQTTICPGSNIIFTDLSSGINITYAWEFGDGGSSTLPNPIYAYAGNDSAYTVRLVVTDSLGCQDTLVKTNYISTRKPKPAFTVQDTSSVCTLLESKFTFLGQDYESFYWDFGDGATSTLQDPHHFYNTYGTYTAKLFLRGFGGCLDSASAIINVYNPFAATGFTYNPLTACNSLNVDFSINPPPATRFTFYASDGFVDSSQTKVFSHLYKSFGFYGPYVMLYDSVGCHALVGGPSTIRILGALPLFGMSKKNFCDTGSVLFANYTIANDPVISSTWDFGDGTTSMVKDPSHTFTQPGTYVVSLTANTQSGCSNTLTDTVRVYGTPQPILADTVVCIDQLLSLRGLLQTPDTAINWLWTLGNGQTSTQQNPTISFGSSGTYQVSVEASNKLGCKASATSNIFVPPAPIINILQNPVVIPVGTGVNLPVSYGTGIATYAWTPAKNLSCADCPVPFADPRFTTNYKITVADQYGCANSAELTVNVTCGDKNFFVPNTFSPNNDGHNDVFYPRGNGLTRVQSLRVYNRWGELVFDRRNFLANDPSAGWNGQYKNRPAEQGVYVYVIEFICDNGAIVPSKGNVALIR